MLELTADGSCQYLPHPTLPYPVSHWYPKCLALQCTTRQPCCEGIAADSHAHGRSVKILCLLHEGWLYTIRANQAN